MIFKIIHQIPFGHFCIVFKIPFRCFDLFSVYLWCFLKCEPNVWMLCPHRHLPVEQELQLHLGVLQQHAALMIGGATATPCPICHKVVFGGEALVEHMKNTHKDPNASGVASKFRIRSFEILKFEKRTSSSDLFLFYQV